MAFTGKTEFGKVLAAKLRSQLVVDGLFRREYKGDALGVAVKTPMTTDDELTAEKCEELADLYISKLKDDKPKVLTK